MNYSRSKLYALGEPLGESATKLEVGRIVYGGGGKSSSSSSQSTTTTNIDKRQVVAEGGIGVTVDSGNTINVESVDANVINKAFDALQTNDTLNGQGFATLLGLADKLFTAGGQIIENGQQATLAQIGAVNTATNTAKGAVDQKTLIILAASGLGFMYLKGKK